jgi:hypothetical protein
MQEKWCPRYHKTILLGIKPDLMYAIMDMDELGLNKIVGE